MENDKIRAIISGDEPYAYVSMEKRNSPYGHIVVLSKILALMVIQQAASRCPEIIESRDRGEVRFLYFVKASGGKMGEVIAHLREVAYRLGHVKTQENMNEFRTAIHREVESMVDAGLAAFNITPQCFQVEPRPGQSAH